MRTSSTQQHTVKINLPAKQEAKLNPHKADEEVSSVSVNGIEISSHMIAQEMQYHPASNKKEAAYLAAQALIINEILKQKANLLAIQAEPQDNESLIEAKIRVLLEQEVKQPQVTEEDIYHFYIHNPLKFTMAPLISASHILIAADPQDPIERSKQQDYAKEIIEQLNAGEDFAELARQYSACSSKQQQGNLGQISKGQTVPEFEKQLFKLPLGLAPYPIESRYGFHIVKVQQRIEGDLLPYSVVKGRIAEELEQRVWHKSLAQYLQLLVGEADIKGIQLDGATSPLLQ